jgi:hypothetical protein
LPGQNVLDRRLLDEAVRQINEIHARGAVNTARELGQYLLHTFFADRIEEWHSNARKHLSFRALASRSDLSVHFTTLWRSVALVEQLQQLPLEVGEALSPSHHRALLAVRDVDLKRRLAHKAAKDRWSFAALSAHLKELRARGRDRLPAAARPAQGRRRLPPWAKAITKVRRFGSAPALGDPSPEELSAVPLQRARELLDELEGATRNLQRLSRRLREHIAAEEMDAGLGAGAEATGASGTPGGRYQSPQSLSGSGQPEG